MRSEVREETEDEEREVFTDQLLVAVHSFTHKLRTFLHSLIQNYSQISNFFEIYKTSKMKCSYIDEIIQKHTFKLKNPNFIPNVVIIHHI